MPVNQVFFPDAHKSIQHPGRYYQLVAETIYQYKEKYQNQHHTHLKQYTIIKRSNGINSISYQRIIFVAFAQIAL
jgi:hypothetical protein